MLPTILYAEDLIPVDKAAHFGLSAAGTMGCEVIVRKVFKANKWVSTFSCIGAMTAVGVTKEIIDSKSGSKFDNQDLAADMLGVGFAITIIAIDW